MPHRSNFRENITILILWKVDSDQSSQLVPDMHFPPSRHSRDRRRRGSRDDRTGNDLAAKHLRGVVGCQRAAEEKALGTRARRNGHQQRALIAGLDTLGNDADVETFARPTIARIVDAARASAVALCTKG